MSLLEHNRGYHAEIYRSMYDSSIKPILRTLVQEIMTDPEMSEAERKGKIYAYQEIHKGFIQMYANSMLEVPEWLIKEFQ